MRYFIKNIEDDNYKSALLKYLQDFGINYNWAAKGIIVLNEIAPGEEHGLIIELKKNGFVLQKDKKSLLIEDIKSAIALVISTEAQNMNISFYLSKELGYHYTYLANIFSEEENTTIKQYVITQKIEKIKGMLLNEKLSLKQIASLMKYKNVPHLSTQFKKATGMSPSQFKKTGMAKQGIK